MEEKKRERIFKEELEAFVASFGRESQEGCKMAIRGCQEIFGAVSQGHQIQIAEAFGLDEKIIKTIIKFIPSIKESVVQYEVVCCSGARCCKNGSVEVLKTVKKTLDLDFNQVSQDGRIRLRSQNCFKKCNIGPNIMVNGKLYHGMDRHKSKELMDKIKRV